MNRFSDSPEARMHRILYGLLADHPFFGSLALRMPMVPDSSKKTVASDGLSLYYNPTWVEEHSADAIRAAISYGVLACGLKHHLRREDRDTNKWKEASFQVCLPLLRDAGLTDEHGGLDMSVEKAYAQMPDPPESDDTSPSPGAGMGMIVVGTGSQEHQDDPQDSNGNGQGQAQGQGQQPPPSYDPNGHGEVVDSPHPEDADQGEIDWDEAMHTARTWATSEGHMPGAANDVVDSSYQHTIPWEEVVLQFLVSHARDDYSWRKPNRRYEDVYLPDLFSDVMGDVGLLVDVSASLNTEALDKLWSEMTGLVHVVKPSSVVVIQADSKVQSVEKFGPDEMPETLDAKGRGGTDFRPAFEEMDNQDTDPACVLYFTDGDCSKFPEEPSYPVLWVVDRSSAYSGNRSFTPPFGEVLEME